VKDSTELPEPDDAAVILAAGKGTRMASQLPKVLHPLAGIPMIVRVLRILTETGFPHPTVLVGYGGDQVRATVGDGCRYVDQGEQLGTGHAAQQLLAALPAGIRRILLVHGDEPLLPTNTLRRMLEIQSQTGAPVVILTTMVEDTRGFGRVVRDAQGSPIGLPQQSELTAEQQLLREVNLGAYVFDAAWLREALGRLQPHPPKGEFYLTDVISIAAEGAENGSNPPVEAVTIEGGVEFMGVNDQMQLEEAGRIVYRRTAVRHMLAGVTIVNGATTFIGDDVQIAPDTVIYPFTMLDGLTTIGAGCRIGPQAHVVDSHVGRGSRIVASTLESAHVGEGVTVGPYAHLRAGAHIGDRAEIGNYAEIKQSSIGPGTKMHHMGYIGDAEIGAGVNIGAGVITGNYDGRNKFRTAIEDDAFVGVDTMLRAPVRIGRGAVTGAGAVVLHDVAPGTVVAGVPARVIRRTRADTDGE
jgi:bifunctional UDP-N-acetylglucosamine pyrophosphorylase/glucosamine-1-phosphate N-acetyltransferase